MKMMKKLMILLTVCMVAMSIAGECVSAETVKLSGTSTFTGKKIESDFSAKKLAKTITDLQPGDEVRIRVKYQNKSDKTTDWYMANEVLQTLEKADKARKVPKGTGTPENGGYTYELIHTDKNGKEKVIFSNSKVGGDAVPADMQGLEQATNALKDWFYIQTLKKGETGKIQLNVKFEGETEVNDYMDTDGGLALKFAVNVRKKESPQSPDEPDEPEEPEFQQGPKTGDTAKLGLFTAMFAAGLILLIMVLKKMRKEQGGEE